MTATGPSSLRPESGFEEPTSEGGRRTWAQRWHRVRLVPLVVLLVCVLVAAVTGSFVRQDERERAARPPAALATGAAPALPQGVCAPELAERPADSPWTGDAKAASEVTYAENMLALPAANSYVPGDDDFVFWGDEQATNFSQALGRAYLSETTSKQWADYFRTVQTRLAEQDIDLVIQVVPADWSVVPEALPDWAEQLRGPTTLDYLLDAYPDVPLMDTRQQLRDARADGEVYTPLNSHWTPFGGTVGWAALADCLGAVDAKYEPLAPLAASGTEIEVIRSEFEPYGFATPTEGIQVPALDALASPMQATLADGTVVETTTAQGLDMLELPAVTKTAAPQTDLKALILRDSQGNNIGPGWQAGFAETKQIRHSFDSADPAARADVLGQAAAFEPDVVIYEITERHLSFVPVLPG